MAAARYQLDQRKPALLRQRTSIADGQFAQGMAGGTQQASSFTVGRPVEGMGHRDRYQSLHQASDTMSSASHDGANGGFLPAIPQVCVWKDGVT